MPSWILQFAPLMALCISLFALMASFLSLGWNIYRDVVMKPRLRVNLGIKQFTDGSGRLGPQQVVLTATNYGPGQIRCEMTALKLSSLWRRLFRKVQFSIVIQDFRNPFCSKLPNRLNMAEEVCLIFPYDRESFLAANISHVGVSDSFGRMHWAPKGQLVEARKRYKHDFPATPKPA